MYHELPQPLPLHPAKYLFSAGQDGPQGLLGFGFDEQPGDQRFWLYSPVARGGIPWENDIGHRYRLMIRLHFKPAAALTAVDETPLTRQKAFRLWPNPCTHKANIAFTAAPARISILGMDGRAWREEEFPEAGQQTLNLEGLPAGIYLLSVQLGEEKVFTQKLVKQQ